MTDKQFEECPVCGSLNFENTETERWDGTAFLEMQCDDCETKWFEVYSFNCNENEMGDII